MILLLLISQLWAGTNTLSTVLPGDKIKSADVNQFETALGVDVVPRTAGGIPTDLAGDLGTSSLTWGELFFGGTANGLSMSNTGADISFKVLGSDVTLIGSLGLKGSGIQADTVGTTEITDDDVTTTDIKDGTIANVDLDTDAVTSIKILDGTVTVDDQTDFDATSAFGNSGSYTTTSSTFSTIVPAFSFGAVTGIWSVWCQPRESGGSSSITLSAAAVTTVAEVEIRFNSTTTHTWTITTAVGTTKTLWPSAIFINGSDIASVTDIDIRGRRVSGDGIFSVTDVSCYYKRLTGS